MTKIIPKYGLIISTNETKKMVFREENSSKARK
jgi:hypothetical protein